MAGEFLFRLFDVDRYHELLPCLDELASTRKLSDAAVAMVRLALARPWGSRRNADELLASDVKTLERIIRNRELEPRVFLRPQSLNEAITGLVELFCFEEGGEWSQQRVGPSWVVLEASLRALFSGHLLWFEEIASGRGSAQLAYPRGEAASLLLTRATLEELLSGLATASRELELDQYDREEVEGLIALAARAQSVKRWSLVYSSLL